MYGITSQAPKSPLDNKIKQSARSKYAAFYPRSNARDRSSNSVSLFLLLVQRSVIRAPSTPSAPNGPFAALIPIHHAADPAAYAVARFIVGSVLRLAVDDGDMRGVDVQAGDGTRGAEVVAVEACAAAALDAAAEVHGWDGGAHAE